MNKTNKTISKPRVKKVSIQEQKVLIDKLRVLQQLTESCVVVNDEVPFGEQKFNPIFEELDMNIIKSKILELVVKL